MSDNAIYQAISRASAKRRARRRYGVFIRDFLGFLALAWVIAVGFGFIVVRMGL